MGKKDRGSKKQPPVAPVPRGKLNFSFEFYDTTTEKYCFSNGTPEQIKAAMSRLRELSGKTFSDLIAESKVLHFHSVDWDKTREPHGFPDERAMELEAFQFALLGVNGQLTRVYGVFSRDTFYIVWIDWNHEIWPSLKKHT